MRTSRATRVSLVVVLMVSVGATAFAQQPDKEPAVISPRTEVTVDCTSSPEQVKITNNGTKPLKLKAVSSTYRKRAGEPYRIRTIVKPGKSVRYTFGTGKGRGKRLSGSFVFDNEAPREGVLAKTNRGKIKVLCSEETNAPQAPIAEKPVERVVAIAADPLTVPTDADAQALLKFMPMTAEVEEGYDRALFEHWVDVDGDGCDTRREVLIRDSLTPATIGAACNIEEGAWYSAADGDTLTNPASLDINHVVPLKEAWASGAHAWSPERRRAFANDIDDERTLQAVSAGVNRQQGDADPASWLPADRDVACQFVTDWVAIKARWGLSVDETERNAISATLEACASLAPTEPGA
jgi:hypothetical protein